MRRQRPVTIFGDPNTGRTPAPALVHARRPAPAARVVYGPGTGPAPTLGGAEPGSGGAVAPPLVIQEPT